MMPKIGYGAGAIADYPYHLKERLWGPSDDYYASLCLESLKNIGIDFIDTANRYGGGISETLIGSVFKHDSTMTIVTKVELGSIESMNRQFYESKERLGHFEGLLLHNPDISDSLKMENAIDWMNDLPLEFIGISTEPSREAYEYYKNFGLNMIEFPYSMNDRRAEIEILPWAHDMAVVMVANRIFGGPSVSKKSDDFIEKSLHFVSKSESLDIILVGTTNVDHLWSARDFMRVKIGGGYRGNGGDKGHA